MATPLKILLTLIAALFLITVSIAVVLPFIFDPNDFKAEIIETVKEKTGMELELAGDIKLSFFPWLGVTAEKVSLKNSAAFQGRPLLSVEKSNIKVKVIPLLAKKIKIDHIVVKGLRLHLEKNKQGLGNWEELTVKVKAQVQKNRLKDTSEPVPSEPTGYLGALTVGAVAIEEAKIEWDNRQRDQHIDINEFKFNTDGFSFNRPVNIDMSFKVAEGGKKFRDTVDLSSQLSVNDQLEHWVLSDFVLKVIRESEETPGRSWPAELTFPRLELNQSSQTLQIKSAQFKSYDAVISGDFDVVGLSDQPSLQGAIALAPLNPARFIKQWHFKVPVMQDPNALSRLAMNMDVSADERSVSFKKIGIDLDDTHLKGEAQIKDFSEPVVSFNLNADNVDVDRYLSPKQNAEKSIASPAAALAAGLSQLPAKTLRVLNADGELALKQLKIKGLLMQDVHLTLTSKNGMMNIKQSAKRFYDGSYSGGLTMDFRKDQAAVSVNEQMSRVRVESLLDDVSRKARVRGRMDASFQLQGRTSRSKVLKSSLNGKYRFFLKDGAIRGFNLEKAIESAKSIAKGAVSIPNDNNQETSFSLVTGTGFVNEGVVRNEDLVARSSNFRINGKGSADLNTDKLDYELTTRLVKDAAAPEHAPEHFHSTPVVINIGGTLDKPTYELDVSALLTEKNKAKIKKFLNKNEKKINKLLNKLNKRFGADTP
ncbi:MAG: AsmA family protein [Gammaproteobacteria bacterium]